MKFEAKSDFTKFLGQNQILETLASGLFLVDHNQRIIYWNAEAASITGYSSEEALGKHCSFLSGIRCREHCALFDEGRAKPVLGIHCAVRSREGKRLYLVKNVDYLRDESGAIIGGIESFIDITARKNLEKNLRRQTRHLENRVRKRMAELEKERVWLRRVLDAMTDLAYIISDDFRVVFTNRAMADLFGSHTGEACYRAFQSRDAPCPKCPMAQVQSGDTVREERPLARTGRLYEILHTPLQAVDGSVHKLAVFRDITERKEAEEQLREANRELDAFASTLSHDLRTPLTPIIGYADFLQEEYAHCLDARARDILQEIEQQGARMLALIDDILALARVGRIEGPPGPIDAEGLVRESLEALQDEIESGGIAVLVKSLPPVAVPATLLSQVFANLLTNAIRYAGGPGARIDVGGWVENGRTRYFVRDHGPGIPDAERVSIFDPFTRGSTAGKIPGTGIGLATVGKTARRYGGRAWVEETPGGGSTFWVEFGPEEPKANLASARGEEEPW